MSTTLATIEQRLSELIGDYISMAVTTAIAANTSIVSTNLAQYDGGADDYFKPWFAYITDKANAGVERQVSAYTSSTGTLTVRGANLTTDGANLATVRLGRYPRSNKVKAINRAIEEIYPALHKKIDNQTLVGGNWLPNAHFEDWVLTTSPDKYSLSNCTAAKTSTAGLHRGGAYSSKVTATSADGYMVISSDDFPRLLDLMNETIDFKCWAYPEVQDDAFLTIYTLKADGTAQTLNSTTTCPATKWTLLELEDQTINDDIVKIEFRFRVHTNAKYAYFDDARVSGVSLTEYLLPTSLKKGAIQQIYIQTGSHAEDPCDDIHATLWARVWMWDVIDDGTDKWLVIPQGYTTLGRIRLIGSSPLDNLSADTDTVNLDEGGRLNMLYNYAAFKLFEMEGKPFNMEAQGQRVDESDFYGKYMRLRRLHAMTTPSGTLRV